MTMQTQTQNAVAKPAAPQMGGVLQRKCACGGATGPTGECAACKQKREAREGTVQRSATNSSPVNEVPEIVHDVLRSPGQPLERNTQAFMESRFGQNFSNVRVHTDAAAASSARAVNALAYTVGRDVVFDQGQYRPNTTVGRSLIAHELTHTLQQSADGLHKHTSHGGNIGLAETDRTEREAEFNARNLETGNRLDVSGTTFGVARQAAGSSVTVTAPLTLHSCFPHMHTLMSALETGMGWLDLSIARLEAFASAPTDHANAATATAFQRHFHTNDVSTARLVVQRLRIIRSDLSQRKPTDRDAGDSTPRSISLECHDATDRICGSAEAYVPGDDNSKLVLCPSFLTRPSVESRANTLIHEMAHTISHSSSTAVITDRAYDTDRLSPMLTPAEALDNADSYSAFAREIGTGAVSDTRPPEDQVDEDCNADARSKVRQSMAWLERWNFRAEVQVPKRDDLLDVHLGGHSDAIKATAQDLFRRARGLLDQPIKVQCDQRATTGRSAYSQAGTDHSTAGTIIGGIVGGLLGAIGGGLLGAAIGGGVVGILAGAGTLLGGLLGGFLGNKIGQAVSTPNSIHLSPTWKGQTPDQRGESLLAAVYEMLGASADDARKHAMLAHAIHQFYFRAAPPAPTSPAPGAATSPHP
jgi:hypothetical protein